MLSNNWKNVLRSDLGKILSKKYSELMFEQLQNVVFRMCLIIILHKHSKSIQNFLPKEFRIFYNMKTFYIYH